MPLVQTDIYRFGDFELHPAARAFLRRGEKVPLAPKTFDVLTCLVANAGRVVLKDELLKTVWPGAFVEESNLTQHIFWLRKALADKASYIVTIPGSGYQFTAPVHRLSEHDRLPPPPNPFTPNGAQLHLHQLTERTHVVFEETTTTAPPLPLPARLRSRWPLAPRLTVAFAASLLLLALAAWGLYRFNHRTVPGDHHELVLADFQNSTGDPSFDRALKTLLAIDLNQSPYLVVAAEADTAKTLSLMNRPSDAALTPAIAREVCERMNDQAVLSGLIARFGQKYLITLTASDCSTGKDLVQTKAVASSRDGVINAVDSVASDMRRQLGETLKPRPNAAQPLPLVHTFSLDALRVYSQASSLYAVGRRREAIPLLQRATELDPGFAVAYLDLARAYASLNEDNLARSAITKAFQLPDQGDELLRLRISASYNSLVTGDLHARLRDLLALTQMFPNQPQPFIDLTNLQNAIGHPELGIEPGRRAVALDPNNGYAYSALCASLRSAGFVGEARSICLDAIRRGLAYSVIRGETFEIAFLQHDTPLLNQQIEWSKGKDEQYEFPIFPLFYAGKAHAAVALWLQLVDNYKKQGLAERADRSLRVLLRREADYNMNADLQRQIASIDPTKFPQNVVIANAELGRVAAAQAGLKILTGQPNLNTIERDYDNAQAVAAIALARNKPDEAIADLEVARPYDFSSLEGLSMRGRAYLAAHQPALAAAEFKKVIDHQFISPMSQDVPLAHLGLARADAMQGNPAAARQEYETLFTLWKDADPDLPPLQQARLEYSRLK